MTKEDVGSKMDTDCNVVMEVNYDYKPPSGETYLKERVKSKAGESYYFTEWVGSNGKQWYDNAEQKTSKRSKTVTIKVK